MIIFFNLTHEKNFIIIFLMTRRNLEFPGQERLAQKYASWKLKIIIILRLISHGV